MDLDLCECVRKKQAFQACFFGWGLSLVFVRTEH
jgi:hypothetical protein